MNTFAVTLMVNNESVTYHTVAIDAEDAQQRVIDCVTENGDVSGDVSSVRLVRPF